MAINQTNPIPYRRRDLTRGCHRRSSPDPHRNSITTHTNSRLRKLITSIIAESKYLTKDIH